MHRGSEEREALMGSADSNFMRMLDILERDTGISSREMPDWHNKNETPRKEKPPVKSAGLSPARQSS